MKGRLLAIGDIHGCNRKLKQLLDRIKVDPHADILVFIGDYIDRGP
ncbi:MAG: metallophosphoesterase, partial [Thermodesulfobacteriota bacterium]